MGDKPINYIYFIIIHYYY